jgi:uncharacterized membrane protein YkvA (DUF1232 family)
VRRRQYQGHPLVKLAGAAARLPRYLKLAHGLAREASVPAIRKTALVGGIGYAILPFDVIPGIIPILGQLDDLAALLLGLQVVLGGCSQDVRLAHLERVGLSETAIDADLQTVRTAAAWLVNEGARLGLRGALAPFRLLLKEGDQPKRLPAEPASSRVEPGRHVVS